MKYFIFSDCHGDYAALIRGLGEAGYNPSDPDHTLLGLGDYFGRAQKSESDSRLLYNYFKSNIHFNEPILLKGNHELILENMIRRRYPSYTDICNGEHNTIASIAETTVEEVLYCAAPFNDERVAEFSDWLKVLPYAMEGQNNIFTHAWLPQNYKELEVEEWHEVIWTNTFDEVLLCRKNNYRFNKTLWLGHWRAADFRSDHTDEHYYDENLNIHFMDCCTVLSNNVNVLVVEDTIKQLI